MHNTENGVGSMFWEYRNYSETVGKINWEGKTWAQNIMADRIPNIARTIPKHFIKILRTMK